MATFIPNMTDVFPGSSEYNPDWNRIERMLKLRQSMYDQGAKRLKNMYDSVFNSAMTRSTDIQRRDAYLKTITDSLNNISAMDLSLQGNQQLAQNLFTPVLEDSNIVHDMAFTKKVQSEMQKAESLRNSADADTRKRYWDVGVKVLQYRTEEYQKANDDQALGMSAPRYIPQIDLLKMSQDMFKDSGISVKVDQSDGKYIWTRKNGDVVFPITQTYVNTLFSMDQGVKDMVQAQAYVERKDFIKENAVKYGGEDAAEMFYLNNIIQNAGQTVMQQSADASKEVQDLRTKKDAWDKKIREVGIVPGSDEHKAYLADLEKLRMAEAGVNSINNSIPPSQTINTSNINEMRTLADAMVAQSNFNIVGNQIAKLLAARNAEVTMKADPIGLTQLRMDLTLRNSKIMEGIRFEYDKRMEKIKHEYELEKLEKEIEGGKYDGKTGQDSPINNPNTILNQPLVFEDQKNEADDGMFFDVLGNTDGTTTSTGETSSTEDDEASEEYKKRAADAVLGRKN